LSIRFLLFPQANVICRQLGFSQGASEVFGNSHFGIVPSDFSYDEVGCTGSETTLEQCPHANTEDCGPSEGAGVTCAGTAPPVGKKT
jgi:hypothetical protein